MDAYIFFPFFFFLKPSLYHFLMSHSLSFDRRCVGFDHVWLPCGGADRDGEANGVWSVYSASGPYLVQANATVAAAWVVTGTPVTLEASALLANFVNLTSGK